MLLFLKASFLALHFSYYTVMVFLMTFSWQQLELASELESIQQDTID